ncbi:tetratricopeptide repeat protein [Candidatus Methylocalor cossyra]
MVALPFTHAHGHQGDPAARPTPEARLGDIQFPTSAHSEEAQAHFLRGVSALHSFSYDLALAEFRKATEREPEFMMGYWGEAMAHNHPLWGQQNTEAARKALARIQDTPRLTAKERAYWLAVKRLYGEGDKDTRDRAYAAAMESIHRQYPDDLEAACLYALALLGSVRPDDPAALRTRMRAGAIALEVVQKDPQHPGATHYLLHAFDDPDHAILALAAARRYPEIAPEAPHALHMPAHIFLQLGMWPEAAATQEKEWAQQNALPAVQRDYHSLYWLLYVYLQQGRYHEAEDLLMRMQKYLAEGPRNDQAFLGYGTFIASSMAAAFVVDTRRWERASPLIGPLRQDTAGFVKASEGNPGPYQAFARYVQALWLFTEGMAAVSGNAPDARKRLDDLQALEQRAGAAELPGTGVPLAKVLAIQRLELAAMASASAGQLNQAIQTLEAATNVEDALPSLPGPPPWIKPAHEMLGEILLQAEHPADAERQFATALFRYPHRARSLLGSARAAARQGHRDEALDAYAKFLEQWQPGDGGLSERQEAQRYLTPTGTH